MSTLFENYYDSLGHELAIGSTVLGMTSGYTIYGHVIRFEKDKKGEDKIVIIPDIGYRTNKEIKLKKTYKIGWKNVYLIKIKKK